MIILRSIYHSLPLKLCLQLSLNICGWNPKYLVAKRKKKNQKQIAKHCIRICYSVNFRSLITQAISTLLVGIYGGHLSEFILLEVTATQIAFISQKRAKRANIIFPDVFGNIKQINWVRFLTWDKERGYCGRQGHESFIKHFISRPSKAFIVLACSRLVKCWEHLMCILLL